MTDDPYEEMFRTNLSVRREEEGRPVAEEDIEIIARCPVLWSGWECDFAVLLYRIRSTGETGLHVVAGVSHAGDKGPVAMLEERLEAYREAIAQTEAFLERVRQYGEMQDLQDLEEATKAVRETRAEYRKRSWREGDG